MLTQSENCEQLINFLLGRWRLIINFAALEKVYNASCQFAKDNNLPIPKTPVIFMPQACRQIEIIKQYIIETLPEARFIDYNYEAQMPLNPNDFVEVYVADHEMCIDKVKEVVKRMCITNLNANDVDQIDESPHPDMAADSDSAQQE